MNDAFLKRISLQSQFYSKQLKKTVMMIKKETERESKQQYEVSYHYRQKYDCLYRQFVLAINEERNFHLTPQQNNVKGQEKGISQNFMLRFFLRIDAVF